MNGQREVVAAVATAGSDTAGRQHPADTRAIATLAPTEKERAQFFARMGAGTPMTRPGNPDEVAAFIAFLASAAAPHVTGADFQVDGGYGQV